MLTRLRIFLMNIIKKSEYIVKTVKFLSYAPCALNPLEEKKDLNIVKIFAIN